ncbi:MAG: FAD:protein FMN transferase, partial [Planctomycetaceae bacterium]
AAEEALRNVESHMSAHLADTDISRFNLAKVGEEVPMDPDTIKVLRIAQQYAKTTDGLFDVTCRPLLQLWKRAGKADRVPTAQETKETLALLGWDNIKLTDKGATKLKEGASLDLGGIAKKWAIDKAADAMKKENLLGGIVNVGGDLRCFGQRKGGGKWLIGIKNPFAKDTDIIAKMNIGEGAVCTSGNYERFVTIGGKRYSHIVDPRTGKTADAIPSVTTYGKTAVDAGIWATALSVTGKDGLKLIPKESGVEAMLISGEPKNYKFIYTDGFAKLLNELPLEPPPPLTQPASQP